MILKEKLDVVVNYKYTISIDKDSMEPMYDHSFDLECGDIANTELNFLKNFLSEDEFKKLVIYLIGVCEGAYAVGNCDSASERYVIINEHHINYTINEEAIKLYIESDADINIKNWNNTTTDNKPDSECENISEAIKLKLKEHADHLKEEEDLRKAEFVESRNKRDQVLKELYPAFKELLMLHRNDYEYPKRTCLWNFKEIVDDNSVRRCYAYKGVEISEIFDRLIDMFNDDDTHDCRYILYGRSYNVMSKK